MSRKLFLVRFLKYADVRETWQAEGRGRESPIFAGAVAGEGEVSVWIFLSSVVLIVGSVDVDRDCRIGISVCDSECFREVMVWVETGVVVFCIGFWLRMSISVCWSSDTCEERRETSERSQSYEGLGGGVGGLSTV